MKQILFFVVISSLTLTAQDVSVSLTLENRDCAGPSGVQYFILPICFLDPSTRGLSDMDMNCQNTANSQGLTGTWQLMANGGGRTIVDQGIENSNMINLMGQDLGITYQDLVDVPGHEAIPAGTFYEVTADGNIIDAGGVWACPGQPHNCTSHLILGNDTNHCNNWYSTGFSGATGLHMINNIEMIQSGSGTVPWATLPNCAWGDQYDEPAPMLTSSSGVSCDPAVFSSSDAHIMCVQVSN